jgi:hypothetical protein
MTAVEARKGYNSRFKFTKADISISRLGILGMILCFALGIANIFTFNIFIIIFAIIAM